VFTARYGLGIHLYLRSVLYCKVYMLPGSTIQLRESYRIQVKHKANERSNHKKHAIRSYVLPVTEIMVSERSSPSVQLGACV
jgi:hypothetical protein